MSAELINLRFTPDPVGEALGTDYCKFTSPVGIRGLAKETGDRLDILAVVSSAPGSGQFHRFIEQVKARYDRVFMWEVWSPWLDSVMDRYGFQPVQQTEPDGEVLTGWRWTKEPTP